MCLDEFALEEKLSAVFGRGTVDPCFNTGPRYVGDYVAKGGGWNSRPSECTTTSRNAQMEDSPEWDVGFRVVMEACD